MNVQRIAIDSITQKLNYRIDYRSEDLAELMRSMKDHGLLQPIGVAKSKSNKYVAMYGNRRIFAAKKLGWSHIEAIVHDMNAADQNVAMTLNGVENIIRVKPTAAEEGRLYKFFESQGHQRSEIAARFQVSVGRVKAAIDSVRITKKFQNKIALDRNGVGTGKQGLVSATNFNFLNSLRATHRLTSKQFDSLLEFASKDGVDREQLRHVARLMSAGHTVEEATQVAGDFKTIQLRVVLAKNHIARLEKKHGVSIAELLLATIVRSSKFQVVTSGRSKSSPTVAT